MVYNIDENPQLDTRDWSIYSNILKKIKEKNASSHQQSRLAKKGVPTDITDKEFLEFLDLNKINYAKAERLKSKKRR